SEMERWRWPKRIVRPTQHRQFRAGVPRLRTQGAPASSCPTSLLQASADGEPPALAFDQLNREIATRVVPGAGRRRAAERVEAAVAVQHPALRRGSGRLRRQPDGSGDIPICPIGAALWVRGCSEGMKTAVPLESAPGTGRR